MNTCKQCGHESDDIVGYICIDCLNDMERGGPKTVDEVQAMAKCCAECKGNGKPSQVHPVPWCPDGCVTTERELLLMRNRNDA